MIGTCPKKKRKGKNIRLQFSPQMSRRTIWRGRFVSMTVLRFRIMRVISKMLQVIFCFIDCQHPEKLHPGQKEAKRREIICLVVWENVCASRAIIQIVKDAGYELRRNNCCCCAEKIFTFYCCVVCSGERVPQKLMMLLMKCCPSMLIKMNEGRANLWQA